MATARPIHVPTTLLASPVAISIAAFAFLVAFPHNLVAWNIGAWTVVAATALLALLLPFAAWSLAKDAATRTWPRIVAFAAGALYLVVLGIGAIT